MLVGRLVEGSNGIQTLELGIMTLQECNSAEERKGERHGKQSILRKEN